MQATIGVLPGGATPLADVKVVDSLAVRIAHESPDAAFLDGLACIYISKEYEILTYYGDQLTKDILASVQQNVKDFGINVTLSFVDAPSAWLEEGILYGTMTGRMGILVYTPSPGGGGYHNAAETWTLTP